MNNLSSVLLTTVDIVVCQVAIAMFGYMTEIDTVEMTDTQEIEAEGELWYALMTSYLFDSINLIN